MEYIELYVIIEYIYGQTAKEHDMGSVGEFFSYLTEQLKSIRIVDVLDILLVAVLFYYAYLFIKKRRAAKLALGVILFLALLLISELVGMQSLNFILKNLVQVGLIAILIVFQPEFRSLLEQMGEQSIKRFNRIGADTKKVLENSIDQICEAVKEFSLSRTGALIVMERDTKLGDVIDTGTVIDAECTLFLIRNIFFNKAPLHDGAAVVRDGRLYAAGCYLPLSSQSIDQNLGTRHRAGLGMSENSDALVIIVSEETGNISIAFGGVLARCSDISELKSEIRRILLPDDSETKTISIFKKGINILTGGNDTQEKKQKKTKKKTYSGNSQKSAKEADEK